MHTRAHTRHNRLPSALCVQLILTRTPSKQNIYRPPAANYPLSYQPSLTHACSCPASLATSSAHKVVKTSPPRRPRCYKPPCPQSCKLSQTRLGCTASVPPHITTATLTRPSPAQAACGQMRGAAKSQRISGPRWPTKQCCMPCLLCLASPTAQVGSGCAACPVCCAWHPFQHRYMVLCVIMRASIAHS